MKWKMYDFFFPYTIDLKPTLHPPPSTQPSTFLFYPSTLKKKKRKEKRRDTPALPPLSGTPFETKERHHLVYLLFWRKSIFVYPF